MAAYLNDGTPRLDDLAGSNPIDLTWQSPRAGPYGAIDYFAYGYGSAKLPLNFARTHPFSVAMTVSFDANSSYESLVTCLDPNANFVGWEVMRQDGSQGYKLCFFFISYYPSNAIEVYFQPLYAGGMNRVALTYDGSSVAAGATCYVDGRRQSISGVVYDSLSGSTQSGVALQLGRRVNNTEGHVGLLGDVLIWDRCLSPTEVAEDTADPVAPFRRWRPTYLASQVAAPVAVSPTAIGSTAVVGTPVLASGGVAVSPTAIDSTAVVGMPGIAAGGMVLSPIGVVPTAAVSLPSLVPGLVAINPSGVLPGTVVGFLSLWATPGGPASYADAFAARVSRV